MTPEEAIEIIETTKGLYKPKAVQDAFNMAAQALKEVQQYREIGTVKECRDARNMQTPEAPEYEGNGCDKDGNIIYDTWICPNCGERYEVDYDDYEHCPKCGKAILQEKVECVK